MKQPGCGKMSYRYDDRFYDANVKMNAPSAAKVVDAFLLAWPIKSVLDVGCARGTWLREGTKTGIDDFHGVDGRHVDEARLLINRAHLTASDFAAGFDLRHHFDHVQSLGVTAHLPAS